MMVDSIRHQWIFWFVVCLHTTWGIAGMMHRTFPPETLNTTVFVLTGNAVVWSPIMLLASGCTVLALLFPALYIKVRLLLMMPQLFILYAPACWILYVIFRYFLEGIPATTQTSYRIWFAGPYGIFLAVIHTCAIVDVYVYGLKRHMVFLRE